MAYAIRLGQGADQKQWEKYCKMPPIGLIKIPSYDAPEREKPKKLTKEQLKELKKQGY